MSWPWSTIGLPDDATPAEIRAAFDAWKKKLDAGEVTGSARDTFEIERAFETAIELAEVCREVYLVDWPYNHGKLPKNVIRVASLNDAVERIKRNQEKRR